MVINQRRCDKAYHSCLPIDSDGVAPEHHPACPNLVLFERCPDVMHADLIVVGYSTMPRASLQSQSVDDVLFLLLVQEACSLRTVWQDLPDHKGQGYGNEAFENEAGHMSVIAKIAILDITHIHCQPERPGVIDILASAYTQYVPHRMLTSDTIHLLDAKSQEAGECA
jgi:hypothetical protein